MSWRNVRLIFLREVRDQIRDRRTLFMVAVLPLLLYPALGIGIVQMTVLFQEQPRTVVMLGHEHLPPPPLIEEDRFLPRWFSSPDEAEKLRVVTDASNEGEKLPPEDRRLLEQARRIRTKIEEHRELLAKESQALDESDQETLRQVSQQLLQVKRELSRLFNVTRMQVLIIVPDGFGENIERVNRQLAKRNAKVEPITDYERPVIVRNSADDKSLIAYRRVEEVMQSWEAAILQRRLSMAQLPESLPDPVRSTPLDLAEDAQRSANVWSKVFPLLLVMMAVTGAFYPAIDVAAGEKERGTMETLLICPAKRPEIVLGKFFTVMLFSVSTALLNMLSMGLTGKHMASVAQTGALSKVGDLALPPLSALVWLVILLMPLAALFSALSLALATFARSSKEGQYYQVPLLVVTLGLTVFCLSPAVEITPFYSIMPIAGVALLLKALLLSPVNAGELYWYAVPVLLTSVGYSLLALWWAVEQFKREDVLFREAERFELGLWLRHLMRDKEPTPSFAEAGFCFVLIMLLQFAALNVMKTAALNADGAGLMRLLMIQQLAIIASPALFMGVMLTTSIVRTFRLRLPGWRMLGLALVLPVALHPLSLELAARLRWFFPQNEQFARVMELLGDPEHPLWLVLLAFAGLPALCEELAFRGFILSGFARSGRVWLAILLSSLTFGIMHMVPQQVFNAMLLGVVLGLIAVRSGSLLPCLIFHFAFNALQIVRSRIDPASLRGAPFEWFVSVQEGTIRYEWTTLVITAVLAIVLLRWLINHRTNDMQHTPSGMPLNVGRVTADHT